MKRACPAAARVAFGVGMMAATVVPAPASAQGGTCELVSVGGYTYRTRFDSASFVHHASGGIDYRCTDGTRLLADSAVVFEANDQVHLFGRVHLVDADTELDADTAQYFGGLRQLNAWSNVTVRDLHSGAVISGRRLLYDRASEVRALDRMQVYGGSPHATVYPVARAEPPPEETAPAEDSTAVQDSAAVQESLAAAETLTGQDSAAVAEGAAEEDSLAAAETVPGRDSTVAEVGAQAADSAAAEENPPVEVAEDAGTVEDSVPVADTVALSPYEIDAERFILEGRRHFRAGGDVVVVRDSLIAFGDSLDYDQEAGAMSIIGGARVEGQNYLLTASTISVTPYSGLREELLARHRATLSGQQVDMTAPAIRMFLDDGLVNRLVAIGEIPPLPGEPQAVDTEGLSPGDAQRVLARAAAREADSAAVADSLFRPVVAADQFNLSGDSIDVLSPGQVLDLVTAVGSARAEGEADDSVSAGGLPEVARRDWMEGDTIHARFSSSGPAEDTVAADSAGAGGDSASVAADSADAPAEPTESESEPASVGSEPASASGPDTQGSRLETMTAVGSARSLYRLLNSDTLQAAPDSARGTDGAAIGDTVESEPDSAGTGGPGAPALHWVEGQKIIVYLEGRQVVRMDVEGQTVGYHLEPLPPGTAPDSTTVADSATVAQDSTAVVPDSATVAQDSAVARPDTTLTRRRDR